MDAFLKKVADILDVAQVTPDLDFRTVPDWDSLKGFSLLVLLEQDYATRLSVDRFLEAKTVGALARLAGL